MKLVRHEDESAPLIDWLARQVQSPLVTSELGRIEVIRAARRAGGGAPAQARAVVGDLDLVPLDRAVQDLACDLADPFLRSLHALHLASALVLGEGLADFVTYDRRLADAARGAGLLVSAPGQSQTD